MSISHAITYSDAATAKIPPDKVRFVFRSVWEEFYDWEAAHCQSAIKSIGFSSHASCFSHVIGSSHRLHGNRQPMMLVKAPPQPSSLDNQLDVICSDYTNRSPPIETRATFETIYAPEFSEPPVYESVAPITRSIHHGDDDDSMAFVPYADDPTFDALDHTLQYRSFSWQDKFCDPDREHAGDDDTFRWS
jgi:histone-lysine N-methyltransferase EZH2